MQLRSWTQGCIALPPQPLHCAFCFSEKLLHWGRGHLSGRVSPASLQLSFFLELATKLKLDFRKQPSLENVKLGQGGDFIPTSAFIFRAMISREGDAKKVLGKLPKLYRVKKAGLKRVYSLWIHFWVCWNNVCPSHPSVSQHVYGSMHTKRHWSSLRVGICGIYVSHVPYFCDICNFTISMHCFCRQKMHLKLNCISQDRPVLHQVQIIPNLSGLKQ